jgi:hypothetical protein
MRRTELVAIVRGDGPPDGHAGCAVVRCEEHAAILRPAPILRATCRRAALKAAAEHARLLEGLMTYGTVLPALPGQRLRAPEVPRLIAANLPTLVGLEDRLSGRAQYQVSVAWQADRAPARFGIPQGRESATTFAALASDLRERIGAHLAAAAVETLALPVADGLIANHAVLVEREAEAALDATVERIDAIWSEGFTVRMIGPYPAVSFVSLMLERVEAPAVRAARAAFGLAPRFSAEALRQARRNALLGAAPGARDRVVWQAEVLACAARLGALDCTVHVARIWSEGMTAPSDGEAWAA